MLLYLKDFGNVFLNCEESRNLSKKKMLEIVFEIAKNRETYPKDTRFSKVSKQKYPQPNC